MANYDGDENIERDRREAFARLHSKQKEVRICSGRNEADPLGALRGDIHFPGARPGIHLIPGSEGVGVQVIRVEDQFSIFNLDKKGYWDGPAIQTLAEQPKGTKYRVGPGGRKQFLTEDNCAVSKATLLHFWRRDDAPVVYTLKLSGGELKGVYDPWLAAAEMLPVPWYGARWLLRIIEIPGPNADDEPYLNWGLDTLLGRLNDGSDQVTKAEYDAGRAFFNGETAPRPVPMSAAMRGAMAAKAKRAGNGNGDGANDDGPPSEIPKAPPYDELPDWMA
jgi:hypothetical protein